MSDLHHDVLLAMNLSLEMDEPTPLAVLDAPSDDRFIVKVNYWMGL